MNQIISAGTPNQQYVTLATAFEFFNGRLFSGKLPPCLITLQRKANTHGYYSAKRFEGREDAKRETDEIALNPGTFAGRADAQILSTLVHEMAHLWQEHFGKPGRGRYHNHEWADKMEALGLMPSNTGEPGGDRVGQRMTHYIIASGPFELACGELLASGVKLEWQSREGLPRSKPKSKVKYTCPECKQNAWAKPASRLMCGDCEEVMVCEEAKGD